MARGSDSSENPDSHHANDADGNPSGRKMKQVRAECQAYNQNDVTDHVHSKRHDVPLRFYRVRGGPHSWRHVSFQVRERT